MVAISQDFFYHGSLDDFLQHWAQNHLGILHVALFCVCFDVALIRNEVVVLIRETYPNSIYPEVKNTQ
jgi:hypothetical protein